MEFSKPNLFNTLGPKVAFYPLRASQCCDFHYSIRLNVSSAQLYVGNEGGPFGLHLPKTGCWIHQETNHPKFPKQKKRVFLLQKLSGLFTRPFDVYFLFRSLLMFLTPSFQHKKRQKRHCIHKRVAQNLSSKR